MKIVGLQKNSFIDFPPKIAAVIFLAGCNFDCWYCHNKEVCNDKTGIYYLESTILNFLEKRKDFLDGVVVSGGEPLLNDDLLPFMRQIKELGYLVKLDTNGTNLKRLVDLVENKAVDYIAMDIKAPFDKYSEIISKSIDIEEIIQSKDYVISSNIPYEFRTTVVPQFALDDINNMAKSIQGAKRYALQQYRRPSHISNKVEKIPLPPSFFEKAREVASRFVDEVIVRGV